MRLPTKEWFETTIERIPESGCWIWMLHKTSTGYGRWRRSRQDKALKAHRLAYMLYRGDPGVLNVCHNCDVPLCVNPAHLFLGTQKDNMQDAARKRRTTIGERHPRRKLSLSQVEAIRDMPGLHRDIAEQYGVGRSTVTRIKNGVLWR